jgi:hypothetical protein
VWKPTKHEITNLTIDRRTQRWILKRQLNDTLDFIPESLSKPLRF